MTAPAAIKGTALQIRIGDDASPETYAHPCLINAQRGLQLTAQTGESYIPDCDDPDLPAIREIVKTGVAATISGAGILDTGSLAIWIPWAQGDDSKRSRVYIGEQYLEMELKLTQFEFSGDRGDKVQVSVTLESHGAISGLT